MEKRTAVLAVLIVAIVIVAGLAATMLMGEGDEEDTIYWLTVPPVNQKDQIARGLIDGGVSWEPYCSDSILSGDTHALMWSGDFWPNHPCCVLAVNAGFAKNKPELVARTVAAHMEATDWILHTIENRETETENYTALLQMGAAFSLRNTTVVEESLGHMTLTYEINDQFKDYLVNFTEEFIALDQTSDAALTARGYASVDDFIGTFVNDSYMDMAGTLSKSETILGDVRLGFLQGDLHQFARVVASNVTMWDGTEWEGRSLFAQWGVNIIPQDPYPNGPAVMLAFDTDKIDMGYLGSPPAIIKHLNVNTANSDIRIVAQANVEGSAIIVNNQIQSIEDLDGKKLGTPGPASIQHLFLLAFAEEYGFDLKLAGT